MSWKSTLSAIAPTLATALGGPLAGGAVKFLAANLLGDEEASSQRVEDFILSANPEQLADIKRLDHQFKLDMEKLGVDVFSLEVKDRDSARKHHKSHWMPSVICLLLTIFVAAAAWALMKVQIPQENASILYMLFGQVVTAWGTSIAYWVGTTKSSSDKTQMMSTQSKNSY
ncbi:hypothetical protein [Alteromonas sp. a30]|uniref:hypothetical protein n=1 Tax=Alteromonas sp. a30 TaxID=2730917 RepID=UPI00227E5D4B|nr:hypothetical protein [Alteromonas sp. a30]MCY7295110.1 hypothetical protein [Alteromonas sp. a30]